MSQETTDLKVIALDEEGSLRNRLDCATWGTLSKIKIIGKLGNKDLELLNGLAHSSLEYIDLQDINTNSLPVEVFAECCALKYIALPQKIRLLPDDAFLLCTELQTILMPNTLERINDYTFSSCSNLTSITLPPHLKSIGSHIFKGCNSLTKIICESSTPPICHPNSLVDLAEGCEVYVNEGLVPIFQTDDYWRNLTILENKQEHKVES